MATTDILKPNALVRCMLPGRKQSRIYSVVAVENGKVTLRLAWREGETFPILGKVKGPFAPSKLAGLTAYVADDGADEA
jgi:hypothetical protein